MSVNDRITGLAEIMGWVSQLCQKTSCPQTPGNLCFSEILAISKLWAPSFGEERFYCSQSCICLDAWEALCESFAKPIARL